MNEREQMLHQVQMYDFALVDATLFLDSHPRDAAALAFHQDARQRYEEAVGAYEAKFGPLSMKRGGDMMKWSWIEDPWPWEGADN